MCLSQHYFVTWWKATNNLRPTLGRYNIHIGCNDSDCLIYSDCMLVFSDMVNAHDVKWHSGIRKCIS